MLFILVPRGVILPSSVMAPSETSISFAWMMPECGGMVGKGRASMSVSPKAAMDRSIDDRSA